MICLMSKVCAVVDWDLQTCSHSGAMAVNSLCKFFFKVIYPKFMSLFSSYAALIPVSTKTTWCLCVHCDGHPANLPEYVACDETGSR